MTMIGVPESVFEWKFDPESINKLETSNKPLSKDFVNGISPKRFVVFNLIPCLINEIETFQLIIEEMNRFSNYMIQYLNLFQ